MDNKKCRQPKIFGLLFISFLFFIFFILQLIIILGNIL